MQASDELQQRLAHATCLERGKEQLEREASPMPSSTSFVLCTVPAEYHASHSSMYLDLSSVGRQVRAGERWIRLCVQVSALSSAHASASADLSKSLRTIECLQQQQLAEADAKASALAALSQQLKAHSPLRSASSLPSPALPCPPLPSAPLPFPPRPLRLQRAPCCVGHRSRRCAARC